MVRLTMSSISLTFKCQSSAVVLVGPLAVARRVLWNRVCLTFHPAVCCFFSWNWIIRFVWIVAWYLKTLSSCLCQIFWENFFSPKNWWNGSKNRAKTVFFFKFKEKFRHYFSLKLFCIENLYHLLCSVQIFYLEKMLFLSHSDCGIFKSSLIFCMLIQIHKS